MKQSKKNKIKRKIDNLFKQKNREFKRRDKFKKTNYKDEDFEGELVSFREASGRTGYLIPVISENEGRKWTNEYKYYNHNNDIKTRGWK